jgi:hypothetical protein
MELLLEEMKNNAKAEEGLKAAAKARDDHKKAIEHNRAEIDKYRDSLGEELATMGMSANQIKIYELRMKGMGAIEAKLVTQKQATIEAFKKHQKVMAEGGAMLESLATESLLYGKAGEAAKLYKLTLEGLPPVMQGVLAAMVSLDEGRKVTESVRTPLEKFQIEADRLNKLLKEGAITNEVYSLAMTEAEKSIKGAKDEAQKFDSVLAGGAEAKARIAEYQQKISISTTQASRKAAAEAAGRFVPQQANEANAADDKQARLLGVAVEQLKIIAKKGFDVVAAGFEP